jgi:hypothetical protein
MADVFDRLLVACPNNGGMFLFTRGVRYKLDNLDTTGLAIRGNQLVRAIQPNSLAMLGTTLRELDGAERRFDDLHDVLLDGKYCYVVSTQCNEILKLDSTGTEVERWSFPGEPDSWHINCLARWNGRIIFSAFCDRSMHRGYKEPPFDVGFVQDLQTGNRLITGLIQPHSLVTVGDHLLLANSGAFEIHEYDADAVLVRKQAMNGYTRGIVLNGSCVYVGLSKTRNVNMGGPDSAVVVALDVETWNEIDRKVLPVDEIYSIQYMRAASSVDTLAKISAHASSRLSSLAQSANDELALVTNLTAEMDSQIRTLTEQIEDQKKQVFGLLETVHGKDIHIQNRDAVIETKDSQIQHRDVVIESKDSQIQHRDAVIEAKEARITALMDAHESSEQRSAGLLEHHLTAVTRADDLQVRLSLLEHSRSWRLTAPLRALNKLTGPVVRRSIAVAYAVVHPLRYMRLARELGVTGSVAAARQFMRRGGPRPRSDQVPSCIFDIRSQQGQPVGILTTQHCLFIAELIADALKRLNISSEILFERPREGFRDAPHFVICPQMFEELPGLYVAFQMEQSVSSRWFTDTYLHTLENAFAIFDYSITNIRKLTDMGLSPRQFFYLPVGPLPGYSQISGVSSAETEYDVIFYGDINNSRRLAFLAALEKVCKVKVVSDLFGAALHNELRKARLIVNIHYYEGALLETTRIWECLSLGKFVVSERSSDMHEHEDLVNFVDFVDVGDMIAMANQVRHWLDSADELDQRVRKNDEAIRGTCSRFDYFFYRFMLYSGNMSFREFWDQVADKLPAPSEKLCLNLPEYVDRADAFDRDNQYGFTRFPGLKHPHGWMGCAMSYKFIAMWAKKHQLSQVIICEDDVEFPADFGEVWEGVNRHLNQTRDEWDLFSGILADLNEDANILEFHTADGIRYVTLDRMISTVYNVYNPKTIDLLADWDDEDHDVESNTIDRYLERCTDLRVMTTLPFLVGHKEELYSTLWGMQNTQYTELIVASQDLLKQKVEQWRARKVSEAS